jgi:hypothetical protein
MKSNIFRLNLRCACCFDPSYFESERYRILGLLYTPGPPNTIQLLCYLHPAITSRVVVRVVHAGPGHALRDFHQVALARLASL